MSIADVRSAWESNLWNDAAITALTSQIFSYQILPRISAGEVEAEKLYNKRTNKINFFQYWIERSQQYNVIGGGSTAFIQYRVVVEYYKEAEKTGASFHDVQTGLELVVSKVRANLSSTWASTVDGWNFDGAPIAAPELGKIDGRDVWGGEVIFLAFKQDTI